MIYGWPSGAIDVVAGDDSDESFPTCDVLVHNQYLLSVQNGTAQLGGITSTDTTVFALDYVYNNNNNNNNDLPNYTLTSSL